MAKILEKEFQKNHAGACKTTLLMELFSSADILDTLSKMDGVGPVRAKAMKDWYNSNQHDVEYRLLVERLSITDNLLLDTKPAARFPGRSDICHYWIGTYFQKQKCVKGRY